jgi:carboxymethylenebutenolidase
MKSCGSSSGTHTPLFGFSIIHIKAATTEKLGCPVLAFFGEKDPWIPLDSIEALKREAQKTKKPVETIVYPGADHGFFCNERSSYQAEAARDAWTRLKSFFATHLQA